MATPPVFLPGEFHGQRSLASYSPWGHKDSDTTEHTRAQAGGSGGGEGTQWKELNKESSGSHAPLWPPPGAFRPPQEDAPGHPTKPCGPYLPAQTGPPARSGCLSQQLPPSHMFLLTCESKIGRSQSVSLQRPIGTLPVRMCPWRDESALLSLTSSGNSFTRGTCRWFDYLVVVV